jgi:hypothetical protein
MDTQLFDLTNSFNESKLTSNEDTLLILASNSPSTQFSKVKLLIQELKFANNELTLTNSLFIDYFNRFAYRFHIFRNLYFLLC